MLESSLRDAPKSGFGRAEAVVTFDIAAMARGLAGFSLVYSAPAERDQFPALL
jgi:hypothetical protein